MPGFPQASVGTVDDFSLQRDLHRDADLLMKTRRTESRVRVQRGGEGSLRKRGRNVQRSRRPTSERQTFRGGKDESGSAEALRSGGALIGFTPCRIIRLVDALPATQAGSHVADQLLRCGTSPLANHGELQAAESRKDFIHKLGVCLKEIREIARWLRLDPSCSRSLTPNG